MASMKSDNHNVCILTFEGTKELRKVYLQYRNRDTENPGLAEKERLKNRELLANDLEKDIDRIIFNKNYIQNELTDTQIDRNLVFTKKYEILSYLHSNFLKNEKDSSLEKNWGLFDWLAAFYFRRYLRSFKTKRNLITVLWFVCSRGKSHLSETLLCQPKKYPTSNSELKRQVLHHHYLYYRKFQNSKDKRIQESLKKYYDTPANGFGDEYEQIYQGGRDRLNENMLAYVVLHIADINNDLSGRGARNLHILQEHLRNEYHIDKMPFSDYASKIDKWCDD